jgi:hypothetical protein
MRWNTAEETRKHAEEWITLDNQGKPSGKSEWDIKEHHGFVGIPRVTVLLVFTQFI